MMLGEITAAEQTSLAEQPQEN